VLNHVWPGNVAERATFDANVADWRNAIRIAERPGSSDHLLILDQ
jgi:hypothetical protein